MLASRPCRARPTAVTVADDARGAAPRGPFADASPITSYTLDSTPQGELRSWTAGDTLVTLGARGLTTYLMDTGEKRWTLRTKRVCGASRTPNPAGLGGLVLASGNGCRVAALVDTATGKLRWRRDLGQRWSHTANDADLSVGDRTMAVPLDYRGYRLFDVRTGRAAAATPAPTPTARTLVGEGCSSEPARRLAWSVRGDLRRRLPQGGLPHAGPADDTCRKGSCRGIRSCSTSPWLRVRDEVSAVLSAVSSDQMSASPPSSATAGAAGSSPAGAARGSSATQDGCLGFEILAPQRGGAELVLLSAWRSENDMHALFTSEAYGAYVSAVTQLLTRPSDVTIYAVARTVHPLPDLSTEPQRASRVRPRDGLLDLRQLLVRLDVELHPVALDLGDLHGDAQALVLREVHRAPGGRAHLGLQLLRALRGRRLLADGLREALLGLLLDLGATHDVGAPTADCDESE